MTTQKTIGGYEILAPLRSGGMGAVYLARRQSIHGFEKLFAVKTVRPSLVENESIRAMFLDEARLLARLSDSAIAQVYDFGEEDGVLYLVMEYVEGVTIREIRKKRPGPWPPAIALRILIETCRGLHSAHELKDARGRPLGVVHRDVCPSNLMLTFSGRTKVIDFGIALGRNRQAPPTQVGVFRGKMQYVSPEQLKAGIIDRRSDVFNAAIVLYELLTGELLFEGKGWGEISQAVLHQPIQSPSSQVPGLPHAIDQVVLKGLNRDPELRFQRAIDFSLSLEEVLSAVPKESLADFVDRELPNERAAHEKKIHRILRGESIPTGHSPGPDLKTLPKKHVSPAPAAGPLTIKKDVPPEAILPAERPASPLPPPRTEKKKHYRILATLLLGLGFGTTWAILKEHHPEPIHPTPTTKPHAEHKPSAHTEKRPPKPKPPTPTVKPTADGQARSRPPRRETERKLHAHTKAPGRPKKLRPPTVKRPKTASSPPKRKTTETERTRTEAEAVYGRLRLDANPYAIVRIDGQEVGPTPIFDHRIRTGLHRIEFLDPDTRSVRKRKSVEVRKERTTTVILPESGDTASR